MSKIGNLKIELENKDHLFALWKSIKLIIENDVPATEAEKGFLMEVMTDISAAVQDGHKYSVELPVNKAEGCWHCINVAVSNKMFSNRGQEGIALEVLNNFAESLDEYHQKNNALQAVQPHEPQSNVLPLVKSNTEKAHHNQ